MLVGLGRLNRYLLARQSLSVQKILPILTLQHWVKLVFFFDSEFLEDLGIEDFVDFCS